MAIKKPEEYVDAIVDADNFELNFDFNLNQCVMKLFDSKKDNLSSLHENKSIKLYSATSPSQNELDSRLNSAEEKKHQLT